MPRSSTDRGRSLCKAWFHRGALATGHQRSLGLRLLRGGGPFTLVGVCLLCKWCTHRSCVASRAKDTMERPSDASQRYGFVAPPYM